jgi:NADH-ubiquinone oxidoreductase chain 2
MSNAVATSKTSAISYSRSSFITYFYSMLLVYFILDWYFFETSISLFNGLIYSNINNIIFIFFIFILSFFIIMLTSFYPVAAGVINKVTNDNVYKVNDSTKDHAYTLDTTENKNNNLFNLKEIFQIERDHYKIIEYPLIIQFIIIGGITLLSSNDLITIFLSIELQSYGLYILSTIYRNSESSTGAGLTYFLLGGLSSCIILLGLSFLYINSGTTSLDSLYLIYNIITSDDNLLSIFYTQTLTPTSDLVNYGSPLFTLNHYQYTIQFSLVVLCVGFLFKISAAPFHSWSPGVYDAIPTVTTTFVAIIPKISILLLLFDLVYSTWYTTLNYSWTSILLFSSFLSLVIGSILGLTQYKIKRLYAYSTISHVGFILLALSVHSVEAIQAFFFYIIQYSLSNLNAFLILIVIGYSYVNYSKKTDGNESTSYLHKKHKEKINQLSPIEYIDNLKGYFYLNPILAISLSITLYSFIGVPPLVGFFAKQMVLSSALDNGDIFICLIAILTSVISAVYYLYIVKHMFFEKSKYILNKSLKKITDIRIKDSLSNSNNVMNTITLSNWLTVSISILSLTMLLFIFLYYEIYFLMNIISILLIY